MLQTGGLLFLTLPRSCLTPLGGSSTHHIKQTINNKKNDIVEKEKIESSESHTSHKSNEPSTSNQSDGLVVIPDNADNTLHLKAGGAIGFNNLVFESILKEVGFHIQPPNDSKVTDKVYFYCLQKKSNDTQENKNCQKKNVNGIDNQNQTQTQEKNGEKSMKKKKTKREWDKEQLNKKQGGGFCVSLPVRR